MSYLLTTLLVPALVAKWLTHSAAMCSRAWCAQWSGKKRVRRCPL